MKRALLCLLLVLTLLCSLLPAASAASPAVRAANALYTLGLFQGIGQHSDGSPIYALDHPLTRQEAVVLLVRLLGREQEALTVPADVPFIDTADWAAPYVSLAWKEGYVRGVSDSLLDADAPLDERSWLTFLLRALGYEPNYNDPWTLADSIGLHGSRSAFFTRAGAVTLSAEALALPCRGSDHTLLSELLQVKAVTETEIRDAGLTEALSRRALNAKEIYERCSGAVFYLEVYADEMGLHNQDPSATASGFLISSDGVAVTNYHAVDKTMFAFATLSDGRYYRVGQVLFSDEARDLAVLRLDPTQLGSNGAEEPGAHPVTTVFPYLPMRSQDTISTGDTIFTIGSPLGLVDSISNGIVSNRSRLVPIATSPDPYIQLTAAISSGSSGGVLLNTYGEAIGITSATFTMGQNLNLAVPLDLIMQQDLSAAGRPYEDCFNAAPSPYAGLAMYERYPAVPDFGAMNDAPLLSQGEDEDGWYYLYDNSYANADTMAAYYEAMCAWGFDYAYDADTMEMVFLHLEEGLTVRCGNSELDGVKVFCLHISQQATESAALRTDVFPWLF